MAANSLEIRDRGQVTLPKSLRASLRLETGDKLRGVRVGDAIVLLPQRLALDDLRRQVKRLMKQSGVSARDLLKDL